MPAERIASALERIADALELAEKNREKFDALNETAAEQEMAYHKAAEAYEAEKTSLAHMFRRGLKKMSEAGPNPDIGKIIAEVLAESEPS